MWPFYYFDFERSDDVLRSQSTLKKMKKIKTIFCWVTVLLIAYNEGKIGFLTKILFLNEI